MGKAYRIEECGSTNVEMKDRTRYSHGDALVVERQTAGRGQRGRSWVSAPGENVTFSMVLEPGFLPVGEQFALSEAVALALTDTVAGYEIPVRIKWTNDIYAGDRKMVGILIENDIKDGHLERSIVGIGLNVNQVEFPAELPNPTSMALEAGRRFDREDVFNTLYSNIMRWYGVLESGGGEKINALYAERMYRLGEPHTFYIPDEGHVTGIIRGVEPSGALLVDDENVRRSFLFKEIEFVI